MRDVFLVFNIILFLLLFCGYCMLIFKYEKWFGKLKIFTSQGGQPQTRFSIIIPARNEQNNIGSCIQSILNTGYPAHLFEIIVADDFSDDDTPAIVQQLQQTYPNIKLIKLAEVVGSKLNSYKKKAIELAIGQAAFEWIITTDADCSIPQHWLTLYDAYIRAEEPVFVAAPVMFTSNGSFLSIFQCLDFLSLQGITAASVSAGFHSMCNGANLAYSKAAFLAVNGFKGVDNIASGDDMLLMHKINNQYPGKIGYLFSPGAVVLTAPMYTWKSFINQRIRWASKATSYQDKRIFWVLLLVYLLNAYLFLLPVVAIFYHPFLTYWLLLLLGKTVCEIGFMKEVAGFYNLKKMLWWFPLMQPFHITYTVISGWLGKFGKYEWKGRTVK